MLRRTLFSVLNKNLQIKLKNNISFNNVTKYNFCNPKGPKGFEKFKRTSKSPEKIKNENSE